MLWAKKKLFGDEKVAMEYLYNIQVHQNIKLKAKWRLSTNWGKKMKR